MMLRRDMISQRPRPATGKCLNPALLQIAADRGICGTLRLLALSEEVGLPLHVAADPSVKRRAAALMQQMLGRPQIERNPHG
jgi:hypothetical protein